jgi:hypothetical protein
LKHKVKALPEVSQAAFVGGEGLLFVLAGICISEGDGED